PLHPSPSPTRRPSDLIRRVRGRELGASGEGPHERGHVMVISACAGEADQVVDGSVPLRERSEIGDELHLGDAFWDVEWAIEPDLDRKSTRLNSSHQII